MGSCAAPSAKGDDKFITTDYLQQCRNIHVNTASYTLLVAGKKKNTGEEWDVLEFSSLTELKKYRKSHPEKMAFSYSYVLSQGVDKQFRHINIAEADHFKQFLRQIKRAGLDIRAIC
ncbi:hypothetical protein [Salmonella enterica]|nr:hypothetical protein [Salmonella enterica]